MMLLHFERRLSLPKCREVFRSTELDLPVLSMGINDTQHLTRGSTNSLQKLLQSFTSFKAFILEKGSSALVIDLVFYQSIKYSAVVPLAKIDHFGGSDNGECFLGQPTGYQKAFHR